MKQNEVVIIGSGISALTSALLLAKRGKKVTVLEQYLKPGGYLHCFSRFGERFDTGAHYVGAMAPGQPFHSLLSYLGVYDENDFVALDPEGFDVFHFPDFQARMPKGYEAAIRAIGELFPSEQTAIRSFFASVQKAVRYFPTYEFDDSFQEIPAKEIFETSLADVVRGLTSRPELQSVLFSYCTLHGVDPPDVAFGFHALVVDSLLRGPFGFRHGGDSLAAKFQRELERHGGRLLTKKRVTRLMIRDQQVSEIITADGDTFSGEWVISSLHPKTTFQLLDDGSFLPPLFQKRLEGLEESVGLLGISAVLKSDRFHPLRNYYFFDSADPEQFLRRTPNVEPPAAVFLSAAGRKSRSDGRFPVNIHSPSPIEWFSDWRDSRYGRRPAAYHPFKASLAGNVFEAIERHVPGFRESVTDYTASTPLTNLHFNGSVGGSAYGLYHSIRNTGPRAIGPRTKVLNLLLTGQNPLFPGLLGASISGLRTSGHIIGIKPILAELKKMGAEA